MKAAMTELTTELKTELELWVTLKDRKKSLNKEIKKIDKELSKLENQFKEDLMDGFAKLPNGKYLVRTVNSGGGCFTEPWIKPGFCQASTVKKAEEHLAKLKGFGLNG